MLDDTKPRIYTTDNMHRTPVQSLFNYASIDDSWWAYLIKQERKMTGKSDHITLGQVYDAFESGQTFDEILDEIDGISPQSILLGRAFYMATNPMGYAGRKQQYLRILCDENGDERALTDGAREVFGYASHTSFEGLTGQPDSRVWSKSSGKFNLIITKDKAVKKSRKSMETIDLTRCALLRWKYAVKYRGENPRELPVLLHVMDHEASGGKIKNLLRKHKQAIFEIYEERISPIIELHDHKVCPGITGAEILEKYDPTYTVTPRDRMWEDDWFKTIVKNRGGTALSPDEETHIRKTIKNAAMQSFQMSQSSDILELPIRERAEARRRAPKVA
jgi:hypothetical protein